MKLKMFIADVEIGAEGSEDAIRAVIAAARLMMNAEDKPPASGRQESALSAHETKEG